ncbi:MAG: alternate F1F0 ATPase, F1 subunit alpha [Nitrospirota bacterium]|nr:alternate F1F0 ATPase, F1 subunit alpha [Nitrospirota bacterium]
MNELNTVLDDIFPFFEQMRKDRKAAFEVSELGTVKHMGKGIARVKGLPGVKSEELLLFLGNIYGMAFNLDYDEVGVIMFGEDEKVKAGTEVRRTGMVMSVPVGDMLLGRVVDALGRPLDDRGTIKNSEIRPVEREAPPIIHRSPVSVPLQTGLKVVDTLIPIGRGQRELILGDRQTGKSAIALDTIINQRDKEVICVYCAVGQRSSSVAKVIQDLGRHDSLGHSVVVVASGDDPPAKKFIAPYAATTIAEYFMEKGRDVLIVYDDLTQHARAYRELSLLLRRPPGREAYPGDIFYIHARLLERSTHLAEDLGGGSLTALPILETEAQNISAYIPTNLISITDGQIYLSPDLFQKGLMPAVDAGKSVSRVGGKTQFPSLRSVAGDLRLAYAQFEELEKFARFSTRLDEQTRKTLDRGSRIRQVLRQNQYRPYSVSKQTAVLLALNDGLFDEMPLEAISGAEDAVWEAVSEELKDICGKIEEGEALSDEDRYELITAAREAVRTYMQE